MDLSVAMTSISNATNLFLLIVGTGILGIKLQDKEFWLPSKDVVTYNHDVLSLKTNEIYE